MQKLFTEMSVEPFKGALVILDVDGTLVADRGEVLSEETKQTVRALSGVAEVYLCSNALPLRTEAFVKECGVQGLVSHHKKPSRRVVERLGDMSKRIVVIGDKVVTDGLLAKNIGAEFVLIRRLKGTHTSLRGRMGYLVDEVVRPVFFGLTPLFPYLMLMRPTQWVKNLLVFTPLFFAGAVFSLPLVGTALLAFTSFSFSASAMYVLNDYRDRHADALHPTKRFRPLARGTAAPSRALMLMAVLVGASAVLASFVPLMLIPLGAYVVLNTAYSLALKRIPVVDVGSVSLSYVLRVLAGGMATGIFVSPWLMSCVFFGALILVTGKRRAEFARATKRAVLKHYSAVLLDGMLIASSALACISYALYALLTDHGNLVVLSAGVVALALSRLLYRVFTSEDAEYPEVLALKDPYILGLSLVWLALMFFALYP